MGRRSRGGILLLCFFVAFVSTRVSTKGGSHHTEVSDPDIAVSPAAFDVSVFTGEVVGLDLTLENQGAAPLVWQVALAESAASSIVVGDLDGVQILLDRSHGQGSTAGHSKIVDSLTAQGATVTENASPVTPALLAGFDVFWTLDMSTNLSASEKTALHDWLRRGGGLILQGQNAGTLPEYNDLLAGLGTGVTYLTKPHTTGDTPNVFPHVTTQGIAMIHLDWPDLQLSVSLPGTTLVSDLDDLPMVAAAEIDAGKAMLMANQIFDNGGLSLRDNDPFGDRVFAWLASGIEWLSASPDTGSVVAGSSRVVTLEVDASGLDGGDYFGRVIVISNDPDEPRITVPLTLHVTPTPDIEAADTVAFAPLFVGFSQIQSLVVRNLGNDNLVVDDVSVGHPDFTVDTTSFDVAPGDSFGITVRFEPSSVGTIEGTMTLSTNDFDEGAVDVALVGEGIGPPDIVVSPDSIAAVLPPDATGRRYVRISNPGGADLWFFLSVLGLPDSGATPALVRGPGGGRPTARRTPLAPHETGGPPVDLHRLPGVPSSGFSPLFAEDFDDGDYDGWLDGGGIGTKEVTSETTGNGSLFSYHEYGSAVGHFDGIYHLLGPVEPHYVRFWVRSDATDQFGAYFVLRDSAGREVIWFFAMAPGVFYINADVGGNQSYAYDPNEWYLVEFANIDFTIKSFDYRVNGSLVQAGIPFRNAELVEDVYRLDLYNYSSGSGAWWDEILISSGMPIDWLTANNTSGTVPPGGHMELVLTFDSSGLSYGTYDGVVALQTNASTEPFVSVHARLDVDSTVTGVDNERAGPFVFDLEQNTPNPFNPETTIDFEVPEAARVRLEVFDVLGERVRCVVDKRLPGGSYRVEWDGRNDAGGELASGVYFYRLTVGRRSLTRKAVLLR